MSEDLKVLDKPKGLNVRKVEPRLPLSQLSPLGKSSFVSHLKYYHAACYVVTLSLIAGGATNGLVRPSVSSVSRPRPQVACVTPTPQIEHGLLSPRTPATAETAPGIYPSKYFPTYNQIFSGSTTPRIPLAELDSTQLSQRLFHSSTSPSHSQLSTPSRLEEELL